MITQRGFYTCGISFVLFSSLFAIIFVDTLGSGICASALEFLPGHPRWNPSADLNGDGVVNILDVAVPASAFGTSPGHPRWNPSADLNGDGVVNILDVAISASAFGTTSLVLRGLSWYGIGTDNPVDFYRMTEEYFGFLVETFPDMNFLCLPVEANKIMPNIEEKDYTTIDNQKLNLLKDFVSWSEAQNIKILIINNWEPTVSGVLTKFWEFMAQEFLGESTIAGFDIINEPWSFIHTWEGLIESYERIIDAIRSVDPDRTCYVQSMYYHYESAAWREILTSNPVNRSNIVYVSHLYSNNANTGEWYDSYTCPWVQYYLSHDYEKAKEVLRSTTEEGYGGLYERFGFITQELGYPVAVTEVGFLATEEGLRYGRDVLEILNDWNINWAYHPCYTSLDRPLSLTYPNGTLRSQATVLQDGFP